MGMLSNAVSGLQASQNALRTTGHNISNANTVGYSRQVVDFGTRPEQLAGAAGFIGSGVTAQSIERVASEFLINQLRSDTTTFNDLNSFNEKISGIDSLLADSGTGLSNGLQKLFAAVQTGADDPASALARQVIVDQAASLTSRFNGLYTRLEELSANVSAELRVVISEVNTIARTVGEINETIRIQKGIAQGEIWVNLRFIFRLNDGEKIDLLYHLDHLDRQLQRTFYLPLPRSQHVISNVVSILVELIKSERRAVEVSVLSPTNLGDDFLVKHFLTEFIGLLVILLRMLLDPSDHVEARGTLLRSSEPS